MKQAVYTKALELGFDECRFGAAAPPSTSGHFLRWIESGQHGGMTYLARNTDRRINPQQVLPGARSIVCVALNYNQQQTRHEERRVQRSEVSTPHSNSPSSQPNGLVARYARYNDYHQVMGERLEQLSRFINRRGGEGARSRWYVDTGPVLEREYAQRAGIGFVGKHTNVISRKFGNWILLGEILTTLELKPDKPERNRCGTCTRCIEACPTNALTGPFRLDARLCISYLTIELNGPIPEELRPAIGNRIFGCDDCLEVCPWNRFATEARAMKHHHREDLQTPDLLELMALDNATFKERFRNTPIQRSKRRGLLRNVCVALGNTGDARALAVLERASQEAEPLIAEHARWAVRRIVQRKG